MIFTQTPFRISLFGGSTDYESYYSQYGSFLLGFTIDKYCYICLRKSPAVFEHKDIISYSEIERVNNHSDIKHNGVRGVLEYLKIEYGIELIHLCDLPSQTGIGSSSAFIVGLLNSIYRLENKKISKKELAKLAITIERKYLKESGGIQDQIWASYGGFNSIEIYHDGSFQVRPMPVSDDFINKFLDRTILIYTGKTRKSFELATIHDKSENDIYKHRIKRLALRAYESFQDEDIDDIGYLLHEAWGEKKKISHKISSEGVEEIYNDLKNSGAIIGGKLLGAGGSCFLFCVINKKKKSLVKYKKNIVNFGINWTGTKLIS